MRVWVREPRDSMRAKIWIHIPEYPISGICAIASASLSLSTGRIRTS